MFIFIFRDLGSTVFAGFLTIGGGHLAEWRETSDRMAGDIWQNGGGHLIEWRGTSGRMVGDI